MIPKFHSTPAELAFSLPIAVYDIKKKKCVLLFKLNRVFHSYLFDQTSTSCGKVDVAKYVRNRMVNRTNFFKTKLTFRYANKEQLQSLGDELFLVLDPEYNREKFKVSLVSGMD